MSASGIGRTKSGSAWVSRLKIGSRGLSFLQKTIQWGDLDATDNVLRLDWFGWGVPRATSLIVRQAVNRASNY